MELALEQYDVTRRRSTAFNDFEKTMQSGHVVQFEVVDEGETTEDDALAVPPTWSAGPNERWQKVDVDSVGPALTESSLNSRVELTEIIGKRRGCTDLITVNSSDGEKLQKLIDRVWGGMRPHPYSADHIARCIVETIRQHRVLQHADLRLGQEQRRIAEQLLGPAVEIEMSTSGENAARAFVNLESLWLALKQDVRDDLGPVFDSHGYWLAKVLGENWHSLSKLGRL